MKIKRIYIKDYKNIHEQTLTFSDEAGYLALIGENGSGKTNWLEAVSMIFRSLYSKDVPFTYEVEYESGEQQYKIAHKKRGESFTMSIRCNGKVVKRSDVILPRIMACYSGESDRLWSLAYRDYFNQFFKNAIKNKIEIPEMLYVNKYFWNIALIALMCSDEPSIKAFLKDHFGLENYDDVSVTFDFLPDNISKFQVNKVTELLSKMYNGDESVTLSMSEVSSLVVDFRNNLDLCRKLFYYLFIASLPEANEDNPINKAINRITVKLSEVNAYNLSEGEQKMILIKCLTHLLADENTLLVLDEPDAHVHIANKIDIVNAVSSYHGQTILTSHSPIVVNELKPECIRYVEEGSIHETDKISTIRRVCGPSVSLIDGAFILSARKLIVTEGPNDIDYIKTAVKKLGEVDSKYLKLNGVAFIFQGSADNTQSYLEEVIIPIVNDMDKILFIFDYDAGQGNNANGQKGYKAIEEAKKKYANHLECLYYSNDYTTVPSTFYIEDYFAPDFYPNSKTKIEGLSAPPKYRELKSINGVSKKIKDEIRNNFSNYDKEKYAPFRPLLDKLLEIFEI